MLSVPLARSAAHLMLNRPYLLRSPEGDPPAATPPAESAAPSAAPVAKPAAPAPPDPSIARDRAELDRLKAQVEARKQREKEAAAKAAAEAAEAEKAEAEQVKAELDRLRAQVRNNAIAAALPGKVRDGFLEKFAEGLEFDDDNQLTDSSLETLKARAGADQLGFLLVDAAPAGAPKGPDRTNRTTPQSLGAPAPNARWSQDDLNHFHTARVPADPAAVLQTPLFTALNKTGQLDSWLEAAKGRV